jgi:hypothetical protein
MGVYQALLSSLPQLCEPLKSFAHLLSYSFWNLQVSLEEK